MKRILITGFDPFGGDTVNPSYEAVRRLPDELAGVRLIKRELPTAFGSSAAALYDAIDLCDPDIVICVGQAGGRRHITPERIALNYMDAAIPDNEGNRPRHEVIFPGAPDAFLTSVDVPALVDRLNASLPDAPFAVSYHAGTFVCNALYAALLKRIADETASGGRSRLGLFVHVPYLPEQVGDKPLPAMPAERITACLSALVRLIAE